MNTLYIFDFDDTLAMTNSQVRIIKSDGTVQRLNSRKFAAYRQKPGDQVDFSEFTRADGVLIDDTVSEMQNAISQHGINNVFIVTARSEANPVKQFLKSMNIQVPDVIATAGSEGKSDWLYNKLVDNKYTSVKVYEDCKKNINMLKSTVEDFNRETGASISYSAVCILPSGDRQLIERYVRQLLKINSV